MREFKSVLLLSFLFMMTALFSCSKPAPEEGECARIDFSHAEESAVSEVFSAVEIIPLESTADSYMYDSDKLKESAHYFVVSDVRNNLYVYDSKGSFISSSVSKVGDGPGEFSIITACSFNPETGQIEICTPNKMLFYDVHFNLLSEVRTDEILNTEDGEPRFIRKMHDLGDSKFAVSVSGSDMRLESLLIVDIKEKKVLEEISYGKDVIAGITMQDQCFSPLDGTSLSYHAPVYTPIIYRYDMSEMTLEPYLCLDFGKDELKKEDVLPMQDDENRLSEYLLTCDKMIPVKTWNDQSRIVSLVRQGSKVKDMKTYVYDYQTGKAHVIPCYDSDGLQFPVFRDSDGQHLYSIVRNAQLPEIVSAAQGAQVSCGDSDWVKDEDGVSIVIYKYR